MTMSGNHPSLENRIESCRGLLQVFRQERQMLQERRRLEPSGILAMLKLKLSLVDSMDEHRRAMADAASPASDGARHREHLRELASLLEQLLVIERENQALLRRLLEAGRVPEASRATGTPTAVSLLDRLPQIRNRESRSPLPREMPRHAKD